MASSLAIHKLLKGIVDAENGPAGIIFGAVDKWGNVLARTAAGVRKLGEDTAIRVDDQAAVFSCTKCIVGIALMTLVEAGKLDLDEPVDKLLPECAAAQIMAEDGTLTPATTKITLRMLATHTVGYSYTFFSEVIKKWGEKHDFSEFEGKIDSITKQPLVCEPNTAFNYGVNIDFVGIAIERVTGMTLEAYCKSVIFDPLGLTDTSFDPPTGERADRLISLRQRQPHGTIHAIPHFPFTTGGGGFHSGGGGANSTLDDYLKILTILINKGTGAGEVQILKPETVKEMLTDQVSHLEGCLDVVTQEAILLCQEHQKEQDNENGIAQGLQFRW